MTTCKVFNARALEWDLPKLLASSAVVVHSKPVNDSYPTKSGRKRCDHQTCRIVAKGDLPAGPWSLHEIGHTHSVDAPTYVPTSGHCSHGHAPLRYVSSGGCAYCVRGARTKDYPWIGVRIQLPAVTEQYAFDAIVKALGWRCSQWGVSKVKWGLRCVIVEVPRPLRGEEIAAACTALGWALTFS